MNLGFPEMLFLGLLALLLFGPKRLPEIGRQIGRAMGEFKRASSEFQYQLEEEVRQLDKESQSILPPEEGHGGRRDADATAPPEGSIAQGAASSSHVSAQEQGANVGHQGDANVGHQAPGDDGAKGA
jgi:sec-independent protein translocase protein TatB